jgi:hypothetical protein
VAIDPTTGEIVLFGVHVTASLSRDAFLASALAHHCQVHDMRNGWVHYDFHECPIDGQSFSGSLSFEGSRFDGYTLQNGDPRFGTSWRDRPKDGEHQRRAAHDAWLESLLGPPHETDDAHFSKAYQFRWGSVSSSYDPRGDTSAILVRF